MAKTEHYYTKFERGRFYHIYNRTIDKKPLFTGANNYEYFLKKYDEYLSPVLDTYAYNLLGNHFHLLIRINDDLTTHSDKTLTNFQNLSKLAVPTLNDHEIVSRQFRKFFQSYALSFNIQQQRTGTLFQTPFKRVLVDTDAYFTQLVFYIHSNAEHHRLVTDFRDWPWSSYGRILLDKPSKLKKQEVIDWFGNKDKYLDYHADQFQNLALDKYVIDDE